MKNIFCFAVLLIFVITIDMPVWARGNPDPDGFNKSGFIRSSAGKKCWYQQTYEKNGKYFLSEKNKGLTNTNVRTITFDDPNCMNDRFDGDDPSDRELNEIINKQMIARLITRWWTRSYTHDDADFDIDDLKLPARFQSKGKCVQSKKYFIIAIAVDYIIENGSITKVVYAPAIGPCNFDQ